MNMLLDLEQIYHEFLLEQNKINQKERYADEPTALHMSSGGHCYLKHWFAKHPEYIPEENDEQSMRVMRLGTLIHKDYENAIIWWLEKNYPDTYPHDVTMETKVYYSETVIGHPDIYIVANTKDKLIVIDIKTTHSYKWDIMFGKLKDYNPNNFYEIQLASYTMAIAKEKNIKLEHCEMYFFWYKKDNSEVKMTPLSNFYFAEASTYWKEVDYFVNNNDVNDIASIVPKHSAHCPNAKWECGKYCSHSINCQLLTGSL